MASPPRPNPEAIVNHNLRIPAYLDQLIRQEALIKKTSITSIFIDAMQLRYAIPISVNEMIAEEMQRTNKPYDEVMKAILYEWRQKQIDKKKSETEL